MKDSSTPGSERVGRYQLLEPIGSGPCGVVSRAKVFGVAGFERQFAVKRFHPELTITNALAQALSAAARAYGSLEHPRIARMSEFGVAQGQTFTAVEHVAGLDAARLLAEARLAGMTLAPGGALALISQAARAVGYAHGRGLTHLGLAPTNVLINADGDVKITDFGILAAGLPQRPVDVARLQYRIQYLAPEQVANEATSAATDVFALGVIAYELVTGQRTFRGETPQQVAQSIMAGPPSEPALPRPIVRVLHRCLARSPFERFPDARALADALDAALRVAPVPGTRKDIGAQVKTTTDRLLALHDSEMSGMVAMNLGQSPAASRHPAPDVPTLGRDSQPALDPATSEFVRPDVHVPGPSPLIGPSTTMPDMPRPMTTMTGLAPPPIPVPPGIVSLGAAPPPPPRDAMSQTLLGIQSKIPPIRPQVPQVPQVPSRPPAPPPVIPARADTSEPTRERGPNPDHLQQLMLEEELSSSALEIDDETSKSISLSPSSSPRERTRPSDAPTSEMSPLQAAQLQNAASQATTAATSAEAPLARVWRETSEFPEVKIINEEAEDVADDPVAPMFAAEPPAPALAPIPRPAAAVPPVMGGRPGSMVEGDSKLPSLATTKPTAAKPSRLPLILGALVLVGGGVAVAAWQLVKSDAGATESTGSGSTGAVRTAPADAAQVAKVDAAATAPADAAQVATAKVDAATTKTVDAAQVATTAVDASIADAKPAAPAIDAGMAVASGSSTDLAISSTPSGARVYIDGADTGVTPLKLPGSPDRHTIALLLAGHDLYIAQVDGHGAFAIPLKEVTPPAGPAGIKVIKCKDKDRYYVFVDGKPTGMMCPTERIETDVGAHTVEVYDAVTEAKKKWDVVVKDTRLSQRVKIE